MGSRLAVGSGLWVGATKRGDGGGGDRVGARVGATTRGEGGDEPVMPHHKQRVCHRPKNPRLASTITRTSHTPKMAFCMQESDFECPALTNFPHTPGTP